MTAYKCDICGTYYTKIKHLEICNVSIAIGGGAGLIDVCPACIDDLQKVIDFRQGLKCRKDFNNDL